MNRNSWVLKTLSCMARLRAVCDHQRPSKRVGVRPAERRASCSPIRQTIDSRGEEIVDIGTLTGSETEEYHQYTL